LVMADGKVQLYGPRDTILQRLNTPTPGSGATLARAAGAG
jgi:hypothetical protein